MKKALSALTILCLGYAPFGCFAPDDKLSVADITMVDSFYRMQREELQLALDDSCQVFRQRHLQSWIDSIQQQRKIEIQKLIDSYDDR